MKGEFKLPRGIPRRPPRRDAPAFFVADFKGSLCGCLLTRASHESDISLELETARDLAEERSLARLAVSKRVLRPNSPGSIAAFLTLTRKGTFLKSPTIGVARSRDFANALQVTSLALATQETLSICDLEEDAHTPVYDDPLSKPKRAE